MTGTPTALLRSFALVGAGALAVFGVALATGVPAQAAATTRYVNAANPAATDTDNNCANQAVPCKTIQYAVGRANAGDKISIGSGTYDESVDVRISLTIVGAGSTGSGRTTVAGNGEAPSIYVDGIDTATTPDVTLENLDVSGNTADEGVRVEEGSFAFSISVDDPVTKAYTLVVAAAAGPNGAGSQPIANTGAPVARMGAVGAGAVFAGFLLLYGAGWLGAADRPAPRVAIRTRRSGRRVPLPERRARRPASARAGGSRRTAR